MNENHIHQLWGFQTNNISNSKTISKESSLSRGIFLTTKTPAKRSWLSRGKTTRQQRGTGHHAVREQGCMKVREETW
jgi:hypothetical protein